MQRALLGFESLGDQVREVLGCDLRDLSLFGFQHGSTGRSLRNLQPVDLLNEWAFVQRGSPVVGVGANENSLVLFPFVSDERACADVDVLHALDACGVEDGLGHDGGGLPEHAEAM